MTIADQHSGANAAAKILEARQRIRRVAELLDSGIGVPGTRLRVGIEALIGLIPVAGDLIGVLLGAYFLYEGARLRAPASLIARMTGNVLIDALVGFVPVVGDLADFAFKSNQRNARLLEAHIDHVIGDTPHAPASRGRVTRLLAIALAALLAVVAAYALWRALRAG